MAEMTSELRAILSEIYDRHRLSPAQKVRVLAEGAKLYQQAPDPPAPTVGVSSGVPGHEILSVPPPPTAEPPSMAESFRGWLDTLPGMKLSDRGQIEEGIVHVLTRYIEGERLALL